MKFAHLNDIEDQNSKREVDISDIDISNTQDDLPQSPDMQSYKRVVSPNTKLSSGRKGLKTFAILATLTVLVLLTLATLSYFKKDESNTEFQAKISTKDNSQDNQDSTEKNSGPVSETDPKKQDKKNPGDHGNKKSDGKKDDKPKGGKTQTNKPDHKKNETDQKKSGDSTHNTSRGSETHNTKPEDKKEETEQMKSGDSTHNTSRGSETHTTKPEDKKEETDQKKSQDSKDDTSKGTETSTSNSKGAETTTNKVEDKKDQPDQKKPDDTKDSTPKTDNTAQPTASPSVTQDQPKPEEPDKPREKDPIYQQFRQQFVRGGVKMVDALPNGTWELHPFQPSAFDQKYGLNYSLSDLCRDTTWHKDLYLSCEGLGVGSGLWNTHSEIITCIRRAIDGGLGIVIPYIIPRNQQNLLDWNTGRLSFDYLFNTTALKEGFGKHCPQLKMKDTDYQFPRQLPINKLWWPPIGVGDYKNNVEIFMRQYGLNDDNHGEIKVTEPAAHAGWNFRDMGFTIHKQFYELLKITNRNDPLYEPILSQLPEKYIGFHLRQEYDLYRVSFEGVTNWLLTLIRRHFPDLKTIYVAVGLIEHETKFRNLMEPMGYTVISKLSLAANVPDLTEKLKALKYDELAILEQRALLRSTQFYGVTTSTLSWTTGLMRGDFDMGKCRCELYEGNIWDIEYAY